MDLAEIQRQALAAREISIVIDGASFTLRLPTRLDSQVALARVLAANKGETNDHVLALRIERETLLQAVSGWSGVPARWLVPDADPADAPCEFGRGLVAVLLDERPDICEQLGKTLFESMRLHNERRDTAAKN